MFILCFVYFIYSFYFFYLISLLYLFVYVKTIYIFVFTCAALYCVRAGLRNGQDVLELGCGWGSLCLFMARAYPNSRVTAVSNSTTQKAYIDGQAQDMGLKNLTVITADMVEFQVMKDPVAAVL
jgi:cyclopropane fatty-acyl-phospholipid synthase-like methyltransferase